MPARPLYLGTDVLQRARDLEFRQRADRDIWKLGFDQQAESDISGLSKLIEPPKLELQSAPEQEPLPIVVSDRPDAMALQQQAQERQAAAQPMMQPQQQASEQAPVRTAMPVASDTEGQRMPTSERAANLPQAGGEYRAYARQVAQAYGLDPDIFERQINQESGFQPWGADGKPLGSPAGAQGIAQFMPGTAASYGVDVNDPYSSLEGAARHMRDLLRANNGNYRLALAAYNAGQGNVDKYGEGVFGDDFAHGETKRYVQNILGGAGPDMPRLSLNAAPAAAPGGAAPSAPGGASSPPPGAPPAPWEMATGAQDGAAPLMLKENDETAPMGGGDAMLPGDGGFAPTPEYDPRAVDEGPRESRPQPILPTDPTVTDPAYTQSPTGLTYGPIQQGDVQGPQMPVPGPDLSPGGTPIRSTREMNADRPYDPRQYDEGRREADPLSVGARPVRPPSASVTEMQVPRVPSTAEMFSNVANGLTPGGRSWSSVLPGAVPQRGTGVAPAAFIRDMLDLPQNAGNVPDAALASVYDWAQEVRKAAEDTGQAYDEGRTTAALVNGLWTGLQAINLPWKMAEYEIDALLPDMATGNLTMGQAITNIDMLNDVGKLIAWGVKVTPKVLAALAQGASPEYLRNVATGAARAAGSTLREGAESLGRGLQGVGREVAGGLMDMNPAMTPRVMDGGAGIGRSMPGPDDVPVPRVDASAPSQRLAAATEQRIAAAVPERPVYNPEPPAGVQRRYHGTAGAFERPDPSRFDENGLYGPGYYTTSDPRVAGSYAENGMPFPPDAFEQIPRLEAEIAQFRRWAAEKPDHPAVAAWLENADEFQQAVDGLRDGTAWRGANVRAIDVPADLRLLDVDAPLDPALLDQVEAVIDTLARRSPDVAERLREATAIIRDRLANGGVARTNDAVVQELFNAAERIPGMGKGLATEVLQRAGYDGIAHQGGRRVPMLDSDGRPIEHDVTVIFPDRLDRVRNAFSGEKGGAFLPGFDPASAAAGGAAGAMSEGEDGEQGDPIKTLGGMAVAGIMGRKFPGMQRALDASQRRAAAMAARGIKPLNPLQWAGEAVKTAGYSSMIGIRTATVNMAGNLFEPIWGAPKEGARAVARAVERKNASALREPGEMFFGALTGLSETGGEILQALRGQGRYGSSPDHPFLSERTINPVGHALASGLEFGGRVFSGVPDAFFGTIARRAGERRAAAQIATDAGLKGAAWKARVAEILSDVDDVMARKPPADPLRLDAAQQAIRDGNAHANDMTYRNPLGTWGEGVKKFATFGNTPVIGTLSAPFITTPWNARNRALEKTPLGFAMNTHSRQGSARTRFDKWYDAALGTPLLIGLAMGPAAAGRVTGSGPSDPNERKTMEENGWKPYSTLVTAPDGNEYYIPNRNIGNWGLALNVIGEIHDEMAYQKPGRTPRDQIESVARRVGRIMQDDVYAGGLVDLVGLLTEPDQTGMGWAAQQAARLTPYAATARDIGTSMDPNERERPQKGESWAEMGTELAQRWQQATGQRASSDVKTNAKGEPMLNEQAGWRAFAPRATQAKNDPIIKEILANDAQLGKTREAFTVTATGSDAPDGGVGTGKVKLNRMEQAQWKRHRWEYIQNVYAELMADQEFQSAPESIKQKIWRGQMTSASRYADGMIKEQWGDAEYERRVNEAFGNLRARAS